MLTPSGRDGGRGAVIVGMGVDVTPISRVARLLADHPSRLERVFTLRERGFCDAVAGRRQARYAAAFAAKEAVMKAPGAGWRSDTRSAEIGPPTHLRDRQIPAR